MIYTCMHYSSTLMNVRPNNLKQYEKLFNKHIWKHFQFKITCKDPPFYFPFLLADPSCSVWLTLWPCWEYSVWRDCCLRFHLGWFMQSSTVLTGIEGWQFKIKPGYLGPPRCLWRKSCFLQLFKRNVLSCIDIHLKIFVRNMYKYTIG